MTVSLGTKNKNTVFGIIFRWAVFKTFSDVLATWIIHTQKTPKVVPPYKSSEATRFIWGTNQIQVINNLSQHFPENCWQLNLYLWMNQSNLWINWFIEKNRVMIVVDCQQSLTLIFKFNSLTQIVFTSYWGKRLSDSNDLYFNLFLTQSFCVASEDFKYCTKVDNLF